MKIGLHLATLGAPAKAVSAFVENGGWAAQMFVGNPKSFFPSKSPVPYTGEAPVVGHTSYVLNMGIPASASLKGLDAQLSWAEEFGMKYLVVHAGSSKEEPVKVGIENWWRSLDYLFRKPRATILLVENMAHGRSGNEFGSLGSIEKVLQIIEPYVDSDSIGMCLDTAHAWGAGENMRGLASFRKTNLIPVVHANMPDYDVAFASHLDRHDTGLWKSQMSPELLDDILMSLDPEVAIIESMSASQEDCITLRNRVSVMVSE